MTYLNVLLHLVVLAYATRVVCLRLRDCRIGRDRRHPSEDHVRALQVGFGATMLVLAVAALADLTDGGRHMMYVRTLWELSTLLCVIVAALAVRIMQHCRRSERRTNKPHERSTAT